MASLAPAETGAGQVDGAGDVKRSFGLPRHLLRHHSPEVAAPDKVADGSFSEGLRPAGGKRPAPNPPDFCPVRPEHGKSAIIPAGQEVELGHGRS